ncbi:TPA: hypothetical protein HA278_02610 [Candidatus Woesearchaeota archaeon]|nr:hypothetical protein [Candidatus Woesearchaeota archaeon]|tara:strand:- start:173 stop:337 length:165 start_codon:yes stop_codon:yes gene_type:complete
MTENKQDKVDLTVEFTEEEFKELEQQASESGYATAEDMLEVLLQAKYPSAEIVR